MKTTIIVMLFLLLAFAIAQAGEYITPLDAEKLMNRALKGYGYIEKIDEIRLVYPYGYGTPDYIGYFKVRWESRPAAIKILFVDALTMESSIVYGGKAEDNYDRTIRFLDSAFMRKRAEDIDSNGREVGLMQLMSCGGIYPFLDCMDFDYVFWLVHFEDGAEYIMYYGFNDVVLKSATQSKADRIKLLKKYKKE